MPSIRDLMPSIAERMHLQRAQRQEQQEKEIRLLPEDLTGHVFIKCREEAERIRARLAWLDSEIEQTQARIRAASEEVRRACKPVWKPGKRKGDVLGEFSITPGRPSPDQFVLTKKAAEIRRLKIQPLRQRLDALEAEHGARNQELAELRRIADRATTSEVGLIHFLSAKWRSRLELGPALFALQPAKLFGQVVIPSDAFGNELPPQALNKDGVPDLPPAGKPPAGFSSLE